MKTIGIVAAVLGGLAVFAALILAAVVISTRNRAVSLKVQYDSKLTANNATFDNMWKKIKGAAEVTDAQKDALKDILVGYAQARSQPGGNRDGSLAKWIHEAVPNVDTSTFNNLQNIIVGSRDSWTFNQLELVDIANEYNRMLQVFPSNVILHAFGMTEPIKAKIITSTKTEQAFATGKDDDTAVFQRK